MAEPKDVYEIFEPQAGDWQSAITDIVRQINIQNQRMAEAFSEAFIFGGIAVQSNSVESFITVQNKKYQFLKFDTNCEYYGTTPDHTEGHIRIDSPGTYFITCSITVESSGAGAFLMEFELFKNNGASQLHKIHADRDMGGGTGEVGSVGLTGLVELAKGDTVELWFGNEDGTENPIIEDVMLCVIKVSNNA